MAKIGLKNFLFGILTEQEDGTASYGVARKPAKAIKCSVSISNNSAKLYADDILAESDSSFQSGEAKLEIDDEDLETMAVLLGHEVENGEIVRNANDIAPYVGLGRIITKIVNGKHKYKVEFLNKVKFAEPSQEDNTKGESVSFGTTEITGTISALANGNWSIAKTFDAMEDAQEYLQGLFSAEPTPTTQYTVTYNANGGTGTIAPVTVDVGEAITLSNGTELTPPINKKFGGWGTTDNATTPVTSPYTPTGDVTLYAIWTD